jgi:hypothetical protein
LSSLASLPRTYRRRLLTARVLEAILKLPA